MSHDQALEMQNRLEMVLEEFEHEVTQVTKATTQEELRSYHGAVENLRNVLSEVKNYFVEVRNQLAEVEGIPPAKMLAQLVIGASTEALSALREAEHYIEELKSTIKGKLKTPIPREDTQYADFSAREAIRKTRYIINRISDHADNLPDHL